MSPDQPGYGQVVPSGPGRRRVRRSQNAVPSTSSTDGQPNWTVVTPSGTRDPAYSPAHPMQPDYSSPYPQTERPYYQMNIQHTMDRNSHASLPSPAVRSMSRYAPYPTISHSMDSPGNFNNHASRRSADAFQLGIPSLSIHSPTLASRPPPSFQDSYRGGSYVEHRDIVLPPIQQPLSNISLRGSAGDGSICAASSYALPPISAMEDLRGVHAHDTAAVLKRLREDNDGSSSEPGPLNSSEEQQWARRRALSTPTFKSVFHAPFAPSLSDIDLFYFGSTRHPFHGPVSTWSHPSPSLTGPPPSDMPPSSSSLYPQHRQQHGRDHSNSSRSTHRTSLSRLSAPESQSDWGYREDGNSTCEPSPVSPATPHSPLSFSTSVKGSNGTSYSSLQGPGTMPVLVGVREAHMDANTMHVQQHALHRSTSPLDPYAYTVADAQIGDGFSMKHRPDSGSYRNSIHGESEPSDSGSSTTSTHLPRRHW